MPNINLLPWREELRKRRQKKFVASALTAVAAMAGIVIAVHMFFQQKISFQEKRNAYLSEEIAKLDGKIAEIKDLDKEKQRLLARMEIIQQLQSSRPEVVHMVDELVTTLPDGVYYTKVAQRNRTLSMEGIAQSNARVSSLMRRLDASEWLTNPFLVEIKADSKGSDDIFRLSTFSLRVNQAQPQKASDADDENDS